MYKLIITLIFIGICNISNGQSNYFPLEKGASFMYGYGTELYQGAYDNKRFKIDILDDTKTIGGKKYFVMVTSTGSNENYTKIATSYVREGSDGAIFAIQEEGGKEHLTIEGSPKLGDTWSSKNGKLSSNIKVIDLNASIKTDGETYTNCLVLEQKVEDGQVMKSYYKEDMGMVAITIIMGDSEKLFVYLLKE